MSPATVHAEPVKICFATLQPVSARMFLGPLARELVARGYAVHLVTSPDGGDGLPDLGPNLGLRVHRAPLPRGIAPVADVLAVLRLARLFRRERFTVVHAHMSKCASLVLPAAWLARVPVRLYSNHGMACLSAFGAKRWLLASIERLSARLARRVYYVSFSNREAAVTAGLVSAAKATVLAEGSICGVDADRFAPTPERAAAGWGWRQKLGIAADAFVVGHVGRAVAHKGYPATVALWRNHFARDPGAHLLLVGSGEADLARELGGRPRPANIAVVPWCDRMEELYAAMDVVVMPSRHEGLGYTLLEAGAAELPVIGSRIPGIVDAIEENVTGLLIAPAAEDELAHGIARLRADPEWRRRLGRAGAERVRRRYDRTAVCTAFAAEYDRLLGRGSGAASASA